MQTYIVSLKPDLPVPVQEHVVPWARRAAFRVDSETRDAARLLISLNASMAGPRLNGETVVDPWTTDRWSTCVPVEAEKVQPLFDALDHLNVIETRAADGALARIRV